MLQTTGAFLLIFVLASCQEDSTMDELSIRDKQQSIEGSSDAILDGGDGGATTGTAAESVSSGPQAPPSPPGGTSSPYDD